MPSFNLIDEPWIPCLLDGGEVREFGLEECLARSHEIGEVSDPSPLVVIALHRLLLAVLHRSFGPSTEAAWRDLWAAGRWDAAVLREYFARWRHRFDLFHDDRPFYQSPFHPGVRQLHPPQLLALEAAAGNNATLFDHPAGDGATQMATGAAARQLLARQAYSVGFGKSNPFYFKDSSLLRGVTFLAIGDTLFDTLALNLLLYDEFLPLRRRGADLPTWEQEPPAPPEEAGSWPSGYLDYLTWQSRRIHLVPSAGGQSVTACQLQQNRFLADGIEDPFKCYRTDEKLGRIPLGFSPKRALWRDSHTLLETSQRSTLLDTLAQREDQIRLRTSLPRLAAYGIATEPGKAASITMWRQERLPLPLAYLNDVDLRDALDAALQFAEHAGKDLRSAVWLLASLLLAPAADASGQRADPREVARMVEHIDAEAAFWSLLDGEFRRLLVRLPGDSSVDEWGTQTYGLAELASWYRRCATHARRAFQSASVGLDASARTLKALAIAERHLNLALGKLAKEVAHAAATTS